MSALGVRAGQIAQIFVRFGASHQKAAAFCSFSTSYKAFMTFSTQRILTIGFCIAALSLVLNLLRQEDMPSRRQWKYSVPSGYFEHEEQPEGPQFRATTQPGLGLIQRSYETDQASDSESNNAPWERFVRHLEHLNKEHGNQTKYKMIFLIRHGQGFHNVKEMDVGRAEWEAKWAALDGDEHTSWADAELTEKGKSQALEIKSIMEKGHQELAMPFPRKHYTSPLARCLETTRLAFSGVDSSQPFKPVIKELLRERLGQHTCDRRRSKSWIESAYPEFEIEPGFAQDDVLWQPHYRETAEEHVARAQELLDDIFSSDDENLISFTAHSGAIRALYALTGHREVWVAAGALVPLLLKAEISDGA